MKRLMLFKRMKLTGKLVAAMVLVGTVIRTDSVSPASQKQIGAGLRFDQPLYL